ncbi:ChbG/HpnK family deacetylase [Bordetella petrii]|uniref:ChbG/HpnK family deacetylase n=1 Tax=Bordetella petrii TaxID=94624 RepID=UPI00130521DF
MSSGIDAGILQLIKLDRLSAISCLVHGPTFVVNGRRLNDADLDVGLHLNLTAARRLSRQLEPDSCGL